jgi:hypothetical protein
VPSRLLLWRRRCGQGLLRRGAGPLLRTRGVEPEGQHLPLGLFLPRRRRRPSAVRGAAGRILPRGFGHVQRCAVLNRLLLRRGDKRPRDVHSGVGQVLRRRVGLTPGTGLPAGMARCFFAASD